MRIDSVIRTLNEILKTDPEAFSAILKGRVETNEDLANHPKVQVIEQDGHNLVGFLGILNAIVETETGEKIAMQLDDKTEEIVGFQLYRPIKEKR